MPNGKHSQRTITIATP